MEDVMANIYKGTLGLIGNTPLVEVENIEKELNLPATLLVKLEYLNPAGSVKDRIAKAMIEDAEEKGILKKGSVIIEPTSGNTGIGLAAIAAVKDGRKVVSQKDLFEAVEVVIAGKEKKDRILSKEEKRTVAYHEVGHALITALKKNAEPVQKITIVPRTMGSLGYVMQVPEEEKYLMTKDELMSRLVTLPLGGAAEKDCQVRFGKNMTFQVETRAPHLPAEWALQSGIQLTWPHAGTDWTYMLDEVQECFVAIAHEIAARETLLIVTPEPDEVKKQILGRVNMENVRFLKCETNDTWARDHGAITLLDADGVSLLDFKFNGWGLKFASDKDNLITRRAVESEVMKGKYVNRLGFVLEGGSIESDGMGTLLTTSECLLSPNRNGQMNRVEIEEYLRSVFHLQRVLWLDHGYLAGDDTDSHIDTLARFCPADTIAYVQCKDADDEHYEELHRMEEQLKTFRTLKGEPYRLLALPMADKIEEEGERLPATYANFLILNDAVLYPTYRQPENDARAGEVLREAFPGYEIIGIDCRALIKQHGSLHCVTMQYPVGVLK